MGVLDTLLAGDRSEEALAQGSAPSALPRFNRAARDARSTAKAKGLTPGSSRIRPKAKSSGEFDEKEHPRGEEGTSKGGKFVKKGDSGDVVRAVQAKVGARTDGKYGALTKTAVKRFQRQNDLQVDGIVGKQTATALAGDVKKARRTKPGSLTSSDRKAIRKAAHRILGDGVPRRAGGGQTVG